MYIIAATLPSLRPLPRHIRNSHSFAACRSYLKTHSRRESNDTDATILPTTRFVDKSSIDKFRSDPAKSSSRIKFLSLGSGIRSSWGDLGDLEEVEGIGDVCVEKPKRVYTVDVEHM